MLAKTILIIPEFHSLCKLICCFLLTVGNPSRVRLQLLFFLRFATRGKNAKLGSRNYLICVMKYH